ncbi:MAG: hypothetical protein RIQ33_361 [Bacteroidota bacterium]
MKLKHLIVVAAMFAGTKSFAQVGIGTTSPVSTLDVRGSASFNTRSITATTTLTSTDHTIIYSGTSTATLTLPSASACSGREIWVKNSSAYAVTIATTSSQTIDGNSSWSILSQYETVLFMSNGTNWIVKQQVTPSNGSPDWKQGGNNQTAVKNLGTTGAYDLPIITNNAERMRILSGGNVGIATTTPGSELDVKGTLRLSGSTSGYVGLKGAAAAGSTTYTLPSADGSSGQILSTNGSGTLSWIPSSSSATHTMSSSGNTITSVVNGTSATASAVNSVSNTSSSNVLSTTVNGISGSGVQIVNSIGNTSSANNLSTSVNGVTGSNVTIVNSHTLSSSGNTLTNAVNGVSATASLVNSVGNTSSTNTLTTSVNGVTGSGVSMINTNGLSAASSGITSTVNGVTSTITPSAGTIASTSYLGFDASGNFVKGAVTATNSLTSSANTLTSVVNGTSSSASTVNSISNAVSGNTLTTTVNGVASTGVSMVNTNALTLSGTSVTSSVNGFAATALDLKSLDSSIYKLDGTLRANRTVTMSDKNLTFSSTTGNMIFNPSSTGKVGIGTTSPTNTLHVYASSNPLRLQGLQTSSSVADKILVADANGVIKTAISSSSNVAGYLNANLTTSGTTINKIIVQTELYDAASEYSTSTGYFVPTVTGAYQFEIEVTVSNSSATSSDYGSSTDKTLIGVVNNTTGSFVGYHTIENSIDTRSYFVKSIVSLTAGTSYYFGIQASVGSTVISYNPTGATGSGIGTYFNITRIN